MGLFSYTFEWQSFVFCMWGALHNQAACSCCAYLQISAELAQEQKLLVRPCSQQQLVRSAYQQTQASGCNSLVLPCFLHNICAANPNRRDTPDRPEISHLCLVAILSQAMFGTPVHAS